MNEFHIRYVEMPPSVEAVTLPNDDGSYDIYINSRMEEDKKKRKLKHELFHIKGNDFYDDVTCVGKQEEAARGGESA